MHTVGQALQGATWTAPKFSFTLFNFIRKEERSKGSSHLLPFLSSPQRKQKERRGAEKAIERRESDGHNENLRPLLLYSPVIQKQTRILGRGG